MSILRRFVRTYVPRYVVMYVCGLAFLLCTTYIMVTIPHVLGRLVDQLQDPVMTFALVRPTIVRVMVLAIVLGMVRSLSRLLIFYPGRRIEQSVRQDFFNHLTFLPQSIYRQYSIGDLMSRGVNDVTSVRVMLSMGVLHIVNTCVLGAGAVYGMVQLSPRLTLWVLLPVLAMFLTTFVTVRYFYRFVRRAQEALGQFSEAVRETLGAFALVNTYPVQDALLGRCDQWNRAYSSAMQRVAAARACVFPMMTTFIGIGALLALWIGGQMVLDATLTLGALVAFMTYVWILSDPAIAIGWVVNAVQRGHSALSRIQDITGVAIPAGTQETVHALPATSLTITELVYTYPSTTDRSEQLFTLAIDTLSLRTGEQLGIFGPTGSGKSTLANVIVGILAAPAGTIMINGQDQCNVSESQWRRWISYVPQRSMLFATSIAENIRMGGGDSKEQLADAIDFAALDADIESLPDGLATRVGETGITLSGGQRQRVSVARARFHDGRLMILDDTTSAVDLMTERRLLTNIRKQLQEAMAVIISHRVSTLQHCDQIVVMEQGRIVDRGTHEDLLARNALYHGTWMYERRAVHTAEGSDHAD